MDLAASCKPIKVNQAHCSSKQSCKLQETKKRMELDGKSAANNNQEMKQIFSAFLAGIVKLEQLAELGSRYLSSFQQALEFLRRPSVNQTSELVRNILKQNETKRVKSYMEGGCVNAYDSAHSVSQISTSLSRLNDHLIEAKSILRELEILMDKAGSSLQASDVSDLDFVEDLEQDLTSDSKQIPLHDKDVSIDGFGCASFMAVIFSMVKRDYLMQERVVVSLGMKSSSGELSSYSQMWSLRPYVNGDVIHKAISRA